MNKENRKRNIILTSIILPLIVGILVEIFTSVEIINFLISIIKYIGAFFIIEFSISVWLFLIIIITSIGIGAGVLLFINRTPQKETHKYYRRDRIFGIDWQWDWYLRDVTNLIPLCPQCSYQPEIERENVPSTYSDKAKIYCENCGFRKKWDVQPAKLKERVTKEIHRKLRTGEYKASIP